MQGESALGLYLYSTTSDQFASSYLTFAPTALRPKNRDRLQVLAQAREFSENIFSVLEGFLKINLVYSILWLILYKVELG